MLCYARLGCAGLYYAMPCNAVLCYAMLCYAMLCYAMLCYAMRDYAKLTVAILSIRLPKKIIVVLVHNVALSSILHE